MGQVRTRSTGLAAKARGTGAAPQLNQSINHSGAPSAIRNGDSRFGHDLQAVVFVAGHELLVITIEPSLIHPLRRRLSIWA